MAPSSLQLTTPSEQPIFSEADLRGYQRSLADFQIVTRRCAAWVDMRMGKTAATLTAIDELLAITEIERALVFAPDTVVSERVWPRECDKWEHLQHLGCVTIDNNHKQRKLDLTTALAWGDVTVTSYTNLLWLIAMCHNRWPFDMIVVDESSAFKSDKTKRFAALSHIVEQNDLRLVELTGTPTSSGGLLNLYPQIYLMDQGKRLPLEPHVIAIEKALLIAVE